MTAVKHRVDSRKGMYRGLSFLNWLAIFLFVCAVLAAVFLLWLIPVRISGNSMDPMLRENEIVLVSRLSKYWKTPQRGDVIAFRNPNSGSLMLKRIVGLPGENIDISCGKVFIDGCPLDESQYISGTEQAESMTEHTVPEGSLFVLSDNRSDMNDSRQDSIGYVAYSDIYAVLRFRIFPLERLAYFTYH